MGNGSIDVLNSIVTTSYIVIQLTIAVIFGVIHVRQCELEAKLQSIQHPIEIKDENTGDMNSKPLELHTDSNKIDLEEKNNEQQTIDNHSQTSIIMISIITISFLIQNSLANNIDCTAGCNSPIICNHNEDCTIYCPTNGCQYATIICPQYGDCNIKCTAQTSCQHVTINATLQNGNFNLLCESELVHGDGYTHDDMCIDMKIYGSILDTNNGNYFNVTCGRHRRSCRDIIINCAKSTDCLVKCGGSTDMAVSSCHAARIYANETSKLEIECNGNKSCNEIGFSCPANSNGNKNCILKSPILDLQNDGNMNIEIWARYSWDDIVLDIVPDDNGDNWTINGKGGTMNCGVNYAQNCDIQNWRCLNGNDLCNNVPTYEPTTSPTIHPSTMSTETTSIPTNDPSNPTVSPITLLPTMHPLTNPTEATSISTNAPTFQQSATTQSSIIPSKSPTEQPIILSPTIHPTTMMSTNPTETTSIPTNDPSISPTTSIPSLSPFTSQPSMNPTTYIPTVKPTNSPTYLICDDDCKLKQDRVDDKVQIKVSYWFSDEIRYNLSNIECFLYIIFKRWFVDYLFVNTFDICDIAIGPVYGGMTQQNDTYCTHGPCLVDTNMASTRRLLTKNNGNTTMTIITADIDTYNIIKSLSLHSMEDEFETVFMKNFAIDLDVIILIQPQSKNQENISNNSSIRSFDILWYIIGLLALLLLICCITCYMVWYCRRRRSHKKQQNIPPQIKTTIDIANNNEGINIGIPNFSKQASRSIVSSESSKTTGRRYSAPIQPSSPIITTDIAIYTINEETQTNSQIEMIAGTKSYNEQKTTTRMASQSSLDSLPTDSDDDNNQTSSSSDSNNHSELESDNDNDNEVKDDIQDDIGFLLDGNDDEKSIDIEPISGPPSVSIHRKRNSRKRGMSWQDQFDSLVQQMPMLEQMPTSNDSDITWEQRTQQVQQQLNEYQKRKQQMMANSPSNTPSASWYNAAISMYQHNVVKQENMGINSNLTQNNVYNWIVATEQSSANNREIIEENENENSSSTSSGNESDNKGSNDSSSDTEGNTENETENGDETVDKTYDNTYTESIGDDKLREIDNDNM